jgi:hypothetical protein
MRSLVTLLAVLSLNALAFGQEQALETWRTADGKEVQAVFHSLDRDSGKLTILVPKTIDLQLLDAESQQKAKQHTNPGGFDWQAAEQNTEPYSTEQIMRLFEGAWICNHQLTMDCPWNAKVEGEKLQSTSVLYAVDWKRTAFFKNAGIMFSNGNDTPSLFELPYKETERFNERVRILGPDGFGFKLDNGIWLVFVPAGSN